MGHIINPSRINQNTKFQCLRPFVVIIHIILKVVRVGVKMHVRVHTYFSFHFTHYFNHKTG